MRNLTIEDIRTDPELVPALEARARRARAEAVHGLFARLLGKLFWHGAARQSRLHWG